MFKGYRYVKQVIDMDKMLKDFHNTFLVVSSKQFKGSEKQNLPAGTSFTLQVMKDDSEPVYDKNGRLEDNNQFETFEVSIPGLSYPSDIVRGDKVRLGNFLPEVSMYFNYTMFLRFDSISKIQSKSAGGVSAS